MPSPTYKSAAPASMSKVDRLRWQLVELDMLKHGIQMELSAERDDAHGMRDAQTAMYSKIESLRTMAVIHAEEQGEPYFLAAGRIDGEAARG